MTTPDTLMWEVRAAPGRREELVAWVQNVALPEVLALPGPVAADVYAGEDHVVVIVHSTVAPTLPAPPPRLAARPPEQWPFHHVGRHHRGA
jgi:hypothetical protein